NSKLAVIVSVSFVEVPFASFLMEDDRSGSSQGEATLGEAALVRDVYRRSEHLTTDAQSSARFALDSGEEVALYLAIDPRVARPDEALSFDVQLAMDGGKVAQRSVEASVKSGWVPVRFTADEIVPGPAALSIDTSSNVARDIGVGLVGEASIRNPALGETQPNLPVVLLITSDTHRADHIGIVNADSPVETPHIDALARRGVLFENCYAQTNVTNPSHIGLMTGMHPRDTGILDNRTRLSMQASTLAEQFAAEGYETFASTSAFHLLDAHSGLGQGFDRMEGPLVYQRDGEVAIDKLLGWIEESSDAPAFVWLHLFDAHEPYGPPKPFDRKYYGDEIDPFHGERPEGLPDTLFVGDKAKLKDVDFPYAQYRAEVDYLDGALYGLLNHPRIQSGVTAFTADHGEAFGQHGIWWDHAGLYPDTVHIPLILAWPGGPAGERSGAPVQQMDVGRTLLDIAGLGHREFSGRSLMWALETPEAANPRFMLASHSLTASIEVDGWHMVMELRRNQPRAYEWMRATGEVELYHRAVDPLCEKNVLMENLPRAKAMRAKLVEWLNTGPAAGLGESQSRDAGDEAMLAALGYGGDNATERDAKKHWDPVRWEADRWQDSPWR
ncbi:MAG: sulfatase, partial [Planctomycetota bacterium]